METTKSRVDRIFEDWIRDQFLTYDHSTLEYTLKYLTEQLNDTRIKIRIDSVDLKNYLKDKGLLPATGPKWYKVPVGSLERVLFMIIVF